MKMRDANWKKEAGDGKMEISVFSVMVDLRIFVVRETLLRLEESREMF